MKKLVSILLALAMILAMATTAFAEEAETYTLKITGAAGHTYDIYQIYTGDIAQEGDKTVLSNVKYGINHYPINGATGDLVPADELEALVNAADPVAILDSAVKGTPYKNDVTPAEGATEITITDIPAGYYMIVDVSPELPDGQTKSPIILQVLETTTIASKHASIVSHKKVADRNDSTDAENVYSEWQDSADYDYGDEVPFQLSVTLPTTMSNYDSYDLTFHDQMAAGLIDPTITSVYILKTDGTTKIAVPETAYSKHACPDTTKCEFGGCTFAVTVTNIETLYTGGNDFEDGDILCVEYTAVLNGEGENAANIGHAGNDNSMYVCHPDGHTVQDKVTVLTYALTINKIDGATKEALKGAGFTLYKWDADTSDWAAVGSEIKGDDITTFTWKGLDGGKYKLVETTTPAGYNTIADLEFIIDANHNAEWLGANSALFNVVAAKTDGTGFVFADMNADGVEDGILEGDVENYKGTVLPETGAKGTAMLITMGAMLVTVAAVFMVTRKKMSIYED